MALPTKDDDLRSFAVNLLSQCDTNKTAWGIPADAITAAQAVSTDYGTKLAASESPDRRKSDTVAKNEAKKTLSAALRVFIGKYLEYNDAITDPIRESLGLPLKDVVKTPVPRPLAAPVAYIKVRASRILELHFKAEGAEGSARPKGYSGAVIRWAVLDTSSPAPVDTDTLTRSVLATKTPHVFEFSEADRGRKAYFGIAWQTNTGLLGVFSEVLEQLVP
jgi:hypothetical protein